MLFDYHGEAIKNPKQSNTLQTWIGAGGWGGGVTMERSCDIGSTDLHFRRDPDEFRVDI